MDKEYVVCIYIYIHTHHGIFLSHKKNKIMLFTATWMNSEITIPNEVKNKDKYHLISLIFGI